MSDASWKLIGSAETPTEKPGFSIGRGGLGANWIRGQAGLSAGVDMVTLWNDRFRVTVLPTRGMGLWRAECMGMPLGWNSPVQGPVHPQFVPLLEPSGLGWLDGFDEWLCRCGLTSNGAPDFDQQGRLVYPLHGRIANRPAREVTLEIDNTVGAIRLVGIVEEIRFHFWKLQMTSTVTLFANGTSVQVHDCIQNCSGSPIDFQMLYHINYGAPLLGQGSEFIAPVTRVVPRGSLAAEQMPYWNSYRGPQPQTEETVYFTTLAGDDDGHTQVMLVAPDRSLAASVGFSTKQLPCFTLWKNETSMSDGYVTGLEPATNYPNPYTFEKARGRVITLPAGTRYDMQLTLSVDVDRSDVQRRVDAIRGLQSDRPILEPRPSPDWCVISNG